MGHLQRPAKPLVVVLGSTGTGKSELAVELATRYQGEIINADAMQLYKGLPIITNKIPDDERKGIPHHLLDHISLDEEPWVVEDFKREAERVIDEIRGRGNLPILVGGTQYYVNPLLFTDITLDDVEVDKSQVFPILDEPAEVMLAELRRLDPDMAQRWHPSDTRKIRRSLEICLQTGRPASAFYGEQQKRREEAIQAGNLPPWEALLFWVYSERETLIDRLNRRVDKMVDGGLMQEVSELRAAEERMREAGAQLDLTKGIWQSIGYKQFEPYQAALAAGEAPPEELERLKAAALEDMKAATRRYANYQTKYIRSKQIPLLQEQGKQATNNLYVLDSTDVSRFNEQVTEPAARLLRQFLDGEPRPLPPSMSGLASDVLARVKEPPAKKDFSQRECELCGTILMSESSWEQHIKSRSHRRGVKKRKKEAAQKAAAENPAPEIR
ncbi:IPP transferase domain-containing protein [Sarocladium implicatum]|nr:IPP transferase domain-containing protein [Sarocladium implicatum]